MNESAKNNDGNRLIRLNINSKGKGELAAQQKERIDGKGEVVCLMMQTLMEMSKGSGMDGSGNEHIDVAMRNVKMEKLMVPKLRWKLKRMRNMAMKTLLKIRLREV